MEGEGRQLRQRVFIGSAQVLSNNIIEWVLAASAFHPCRRIRRGRRGRIQWCSDCGTARGIRGCCGTNPRCAPASGSIAASR